LYTGLARKWNRGEVVRGVRVDPQEVLQTFLGVNYLLPGGQTPLTLPPVKYSPGMGPRMVNAAMTYSDFYKQMQLTEIKMVSNKLQWVGLYLHSIGMSHEKKFIMRWRRYMLIFGTL